MVGVHIAGKLLQLKQCRRTTQFYSRDLDNYALVNSTKIMSERLKSAHLYHRWMKFHNVNDMMPAYKYAGDLGISYNELVNKLIKEGCFSFVDNRGNANDKG